MSDDKIAEIKARHETDERYWKMMHPTHRAPNHEDREWLLAEVERLRDVLRRVSVYPSVDRTAKIAFVSEGCMVTYPVRPQTTWALEVLIEFDHARRKALEGAL